MSEVPLWAVCEDECYFSPALSAANFRCNLAFTYADREFFIDNLLVRIHFIIVMIRWTGLAPW